MKSPPTEGITTTFHLCCRGWQPSQTRGRKAKCKDQKKDCVAPPSELLCTLPLVLDVKAVQMMHSLKFGCFLFSSTHSHVAVGNTETGVGDALSSFKVPVLILYSKEQKNSLQTSTKQLQIKGLIKNSFLRLNKADTKLECYFELQNFLVGTIIALLMTLDTYLRALWAVSRAPQWSFSSVLFQHSPLIHQLQPWPLAGGGKNKGNMGSLEMHCLFHLSKVGLLGSAQPVLHWRIHNRALIPALIFRHFAQTFNCNQWNMEIKARVLIN